MELYILPILCLPSFFLFLSVDSEFYLPVPVSRPKGKYLDTLVRTIRRGGQAALPDVIDACATQIVSNVTLSLLNRVGPPLYGRAIKRVYILNDKLLRLLKIVFKGTKSALGSFRSNFGNIRDTHNETLMTYVNNLTTFGNALNKTANESGVDTFINNCESNRIYDYPTRIKEDVLSDDARTIRRQILDGRDAVKYAKYVEIVTPLYFTGVRYQALCKAIKNDTIGQTVIVTAEEIQTVSSKMANRVTDDITILSKDYFQRAVRDTKKAIMEEGGVNERSCNHIYERLKASYFFANFTVGVYCNNCTDNRLLPEYYKTSTNVMAEKEYVFKGDGDKENYYQVWPEAGHYVFLASSVGGHNSRDDWKDRMTTCMDSLEKTPIASTGSESDNDKRIGDFRACVERLKVNNFSMVGILESGKVGCMDYDLEQSMAKTLTKKYMIFAIDKMGH